MGVAKLQPPLSKEKFEQVYQSGGWVKVFKESGMWSSSNKSKKRLMTLLEDKLAKLKKVNKNEYYKI